MNRADVELRHLRCLLAVADEGTVTGAAARLAMSQPAVSRTLQQLEAALGVQLVERTTRTLRLTAAGAQVCVHAREALTAVDAAVAAAHGGVRPLRLGFSWAAAGRHTAAIVQGWRRARPDVALEMHRVDERLAGIDRGLTDVALVRVPMSADPAGFAEPAGSAEPAGTAAPRSRRPVRSQLLFREPRMAVVPRGHPLAGRTSVTLADLAGETVVTSRHGITTLALWPGEARPAGTVTSENVDEWLTAIAVGNGVGVTSESTSFHHAHPGVVFLPLSGAADVGVYLVWPVTGAHPCVAEFARAARAAVEQPPV